MIFLYSCNLIFFLFFLKGENLIALLPWEEWWKFELTEDDSDPQIALLPLHPDIRAKFNETAAWEYALSMNGKPYGYHNLIFAWIDTIDQNYPPPLDAHLVNLLYPNFYISTLYIKLIDFIILLCSG